MIFSTKQLHLLILWYVLFQDSVKWEDTYKMTGLHSLQRSNMAVNSPLPVKLV